MQQVPRQIRYTSVRPKGYSSQYKQWPVDPMSSNQYWTPNDVVRIMLQLNEGLLDPFRSSIRIDVAVDTTTNPIGGLQIDNSAQSFINQLVVTSKGSQIQRITQYDSLAAYLTDIGFSQTIAQGRDQQGLGMSAVPTAANCPLIAKSSFQQTVINGAGFAQPTYMIAASPVTCSPTKMFVGSNTCVAAIQANQAIYTPANTAGMNGNLYSFNNTWGSGGTTGWTTNCMSMVNHMGSVRAQYNIKMNNPTYPQTSNSILKTPIALSSNSATNYPNSNVYGISPTTNITYGYQNNQSVPNYNVPNNCALQGYQNPYSPFYSKGCNQPMISATIPQCSMSNGVLLPFPQPVMVKRFYLPLISSIMGVLIPPQSYQLLPLKTFYNTLLQFTLNPYAMFTTGYNDRNQWDSNGMAIQQPRNYRIIRFQYVLNLYYFAQQAIKEYINQSMVKGIIITSQGWMLGTNVQIPTGASVRNCWQINSSCQSLSQVVVLFLTNDHLKYSFCRKQFRLSHNITTMQLKFDVNYYPPQPIQGNAGNPEILDTTMDNSQFYMQLLKSNNFLFNVNQQLPRINRWNFAVNQRCYNPTNQATMITPACFPSPITYQWNTNSVNTDTAMGLSYFHQNRYVGRAAFVYSFQPFAHSKQFMSGIDTKGGRFQLIFNNSSVNIFPRDSTMLVFLRHNVIVAYGQNGVQAYGR